MIRRGHDMIECLRAAHDCDSIAAIARDRLRRKVRKNRDVHRNLVEEHTETATDSGAIVARGRKHKADTRSNIQGFRSEAVAINAHAEV